MVSKKTALDCYEEALINLEKAEEMYKEKTKELDKKIRIIDNLNQEFKNAKNELKNINNGRIKFLSKSVAFGQGHNQPHNGGYYDYTIEPDDATRILGGWWSLQNDSTPENMIGFKEFYIRGTDPVKEELIVGRKSITFRIGKRNNNPGAIHVTLFVLYV